MCVYIKIGYIKISSHNLHHGVDLFLEIVCYYDI